MGEPRDNLLSPWSGLLPVLCLALTAGGCTYLKYASVQSEYARIQASAPEQINVKHMIDRDTFFVHGKSIDYAGSFDTFPKAVAAYSSRFQANERVGIMHFAVAGSHYGLNLPEGDFELLVFADLDEDGVFRSNEVVGRRTINLDEAAVPTKVRGRVDIRLHTPSAVGWEIAIEVPHTRSRPESLYYPAGTIRSLDDPIFDRSFSTLGMYDPAAFLEQAPTMFYALEEDIVYKIPVVFVHGISGSAREFEPFIAQLDRSRYKPWFFHYPSGGDLEQLAELFYQIFLSGDVYQAGRMPMIIIAHSMGGLVVREAINKIQGTKDETRVALFVSIASPFGGHEAAAKGERYGLIVLPSWRDLNPDGHFIRRLFRRPLPESLHHELIYAFRNEGSIKLGENSDGVISLSSQLTLSAQQQAGGQFGFNDTHTGSLDNAAVRDHVMMLMDGVENRFTPSQISLLRQGGYDVDLEDDYSAKARHVIRTYGKYLMGLSDGSVAPVDQAERDFVAVVEGRSAPRTEEEQDWLRYLSNHPRLYLPVRSKTGEPWNPQSAD